MIRRFVYRNTCGALLALGLLLLPGCVWLRLYDLQQQCRDFDRHLGVRSGPPLTLVFHHPPLLADDVTTLIGARPTAIAPLPGGEVWAFTFLRLGVDGTPALPVRPLHLLATIRDGRLGAIAFPAEVTRVVPAELAEAGLRSLAGATVDAVQRRAVAQMRQDPALAARIPDRDGLEAVFGPPSYVWPDANGRDLVYRYRLVGTPPEAKPVIGTLAFTLHPDRRHLARLSANLSGAWLSLDLPAPAGEGGRTGP